VAQRGTYRIGDARRRGVRRATLRATQQLPDNASLDKARRLLWFDQAEVRPQALLGRPDGLAGHCALESMGLKTFGFAGGRRGHLGARGGRLLGPEDTWLGDERYSGDRDLANPLGAVQMGLIYVNPEGRTATRIRWPQPATSGRHSFAWR